MLTLPNNCRTGKISVFPKNWKTVRANPSLKWYIKYRFYDDTRGESKQVVIKGMNEFQTVAEKQDTVRVLLEEELDRLTNQGYNPITGTIVAPAEAAEVSGSTPFIEAMDYAFEKFKGDRHTIEDLRSTLNCFRKASDALRYSGKPLGEIKKRHIAAILEKCGELKKKSKVIISAKKGITRPGIWSAHSFNKYRSNIGILYKILKKVDAVEVNYALEVEREKTVKRIRETLTKEQRAMISEATLKRDRNFWRLLEIFFASGSRTTEILAVRQNEVDLKQQRFKVLVKKGKQYTEEWRTIRTAVLFLWEELVAEAKPGQFLFSEGLVPGDKMIRRDQITRRWKTHVKNKLGITADFYTLKHSNLDEIAALFNMQLARDAAGHKSTVITMNYTLGEKERQHNRLKDITNTL
jgi:integrase